MIKKIKNNDTVEHEWCGQIIQPDEYYIIQQVEERRWSENENLFTDIENEIAVVNNGFEDLTIEKGLLYIKQLNWYDFYSSCSIDKNGIDQDITTSWTTVTSNRILWDLYSDYDSENDEFIVPKDGIYLLDLQMKLKSLVDVSTITLSIFKVGEEEDEEWFILDYKDYLNEISQFTAAIEFDFYRGERYKIKIKMTGGLLVNGKIDGTDTRTAWGFTFQKPLFV